MKINELNQKPEISQNKRVREAIVQFEQLLSEMRKKNLPASILSSVNHDIEELNSISLSANEYRKVLKKKQAAIVKLLEKELKLMTKNHYRNMWLAVGMAAFGIPLGATFGVSFGNMAYLGIGLPIGMSIGIAIGTFLDNKVSREGRQLDVEIQ